ncbi:shikimate dehydrogenase [Megamonas sp.]
MYTGKTKNLGVIGYPIKHSLSPVIQNAALSASGLDYAYIAMPIAPEDLKTAVLGLKAANFSGFNVTIPHKVTIMQYLDEIDDTAKFIGAVNTVKIENGRLYGYNTDVIGFINPLLKEGFALKDKTVVIFGAGGASRAIICGLIQQKAAHIILGVRNQAKGEKLAASFKDLADIAAYDWHDEAFTAWLAKADLLVNTTPLGMFPNIDTAVPIEWEKVKRDAFVYDIVYTPAKTRFLQEAQACGHKILNGEKMLAEQGAASLRYWTGEKVDVEVMVKALREYLAKNK